MPTETSNEFEAVVGVGYFVAPGGNDSTGDGSEANPWKTPQKAVPSLSAGDTLWFSDGTYTLPIGVSGYVNKRILQFQNKSGTADAMITLKARDGHTAVWIGTEPETATESYGFVFQNSNYIRIEGLNFRNTVDSGIAFGINENQPMYGHELVDCTFVNCGSAETNCNNLNGHNAVYTGQFCQGVLIEKCTFINSGRTYIAADCPWVGNSLKNHAFRHDHQIQAKGQGIVIRNNVFYQHKRGYAIKVDGSGTNSLAMPTPYGTSRNDGPTDPVTGEGFTHIIINNTFGANESDVYTDDFTGPPNNDSGGKPGMPIGISANPQHNSPPLPYQPENRFPRYLIANNLIIEPITSLGNNDNNRGIIAYDWVWGASKSPHDNYFLNNIGTDEGNGWVQHTCGEHQKVWLSQTGGDNLTYENNQPFDDGVTDTAAPLTAALNLVDRDNRDYHIGAGSVAIGAGVSLPYAPTDDKDGNARPNPPSVGAYEYIP